MAKTWTMTDIALAAGVSQTTVSMVLNDVAYARIAKTTRERVLKVAKDLGYAKVPRFDAGRTDVRVIGMLIDEVGITQWYPPLIEGADEEAHNENCVVATYRTCNDPAIEAAAITALKQTNLVGVLYTSLSKRVLTPPEALRSIPTVLLNCSSNSRDDFCILSADRPAAHAATDALLRAGHRQIAHLAGDEWVLSAQEREQGYRDALLNWDILVDRCLIVRGHRSRTFQDGRDMTFELFDVAQPPTALFCFNDRMAMGAYEAIRARGLRIPDDISVVGFDNEVELASLAAPPLTTMVLPYREMAREAVRMLLDIDNIRSGSQYPRTIKIECPIVMRESIGPPPPKRS